MKHAVQIADYDVDVWQWQHPLKIINFKGADYATPAHPDYGIFTKGRILAPLYGDPKQLTSGGQLSTRREGANVYHHEIDATVRVEIFDTVYQMLLHESPVIIEIEAPDQVVPAGETRTRQINRSRFFTRTEPVGEIEDILQKLDV